MERYFFGDHWEISLDKRAILFLWRGARDVGAKLPKEIRTEDAAFLVRSLAWTLSERMWLLLKPNGSMSIPSLLQIPVLTALPEKAYKTLSLLNQHNLIKYR